MSRWSERLGRKGAHTKRMFGRGALAAGTALTVAVGTGIVLPSLAAAPASASVRATSSGACASANGSPGVTSSTITTGALSTLSGQIASNFDTLVPGIKAYYAYINAHGGVDGRKMVLAYNTDDTGNPTVDTSLEHTLVDQDHVFAVAGVATFFFTPTYFVQTCTPTFGYDVSGNWDNAPNLFAAGGSIQDYAAGQPAWIYLAKKVQPHPKAAMIAYNVTSSSAACDSASVAFKKAGIDVAYKDTSVGYGSSTIPDVERMKAAGVNFILSCMDVTGNIGMARALQQYGLHPKQLWLNGNDQNTLNQYGSLMQGVYFNIQHVPFDANLKDYPGLAQYESAMKKYEPNYVRDEVAMQGWESAALLVAGLKADGPNPTQAGVVNAINHLTAFTSNGLTTPTNWSPGGGGHSYPITNHVCSAFIQVQGNKYVTVLAKKPQVFECFHVAGSVITTGSESNPGNTFTHAVPIPPPLGTPVG